MISRAAVSAIGLLFAAAPSAHAAAADFADPVKLFQRVCLSDKVSIAQDAVADQSYDTLPQGAKDVLGFSNPDGPAPRLTPPFALAASEVPNRILAVLPQKHAFLLLAGERSGRYAASCAVVWRGRQYEEALEVARHLVVDQPLQGGPSLKPPPIFRYAVFRGNGTIAGAAELDGWTILRIAPDLSPAAEQTNQ
jgi:hypothetical protein